MKPVVEFVLLLLLVSFPVNCMADVGSETGYPVPRFVSLRSDLVNVRRGPSTEHKIDWVYRRSGMPVVVTAEFGHWRRIEDVDGDGGWVHRALISGEDKGLVRAGGSDLHSSPDAGSRVVARARKGVIFDIQECAGQWCRVSRGEVSGWAVASTLWGVDGDLGDR